MNWITTHLVIVLVAWGVLALGVGLGFFLARTGKQASPGPDTRIQRALGSVEDHAGRLVTPRLPQPRPSTPLQTRVYVGDREVVAGPQTTEMAIPSPELIAADKAKAHLTPVVRDGKVVGHVEMTKKLASTAVAFPAVSTEPEPERSLLDMTVPELMAKIERDATTLIPKLSGEPVLPDLPDRRIHAELPDGSEVVRYDRAGKWFHEGPGLRRKITLGQAAVLACSRGAVIKPGIPGGGLFDLRVKKAREEAG